LSVSLDPMRGHERAGHRLALALSPSVDNARAGLTIACPVTRQEKGYPFEVRVLTHMPLQGVFLADQIRSLDWSARQVRPMLTESGKTLAVPDASIGRVLGLLNRLLFQPDA